MTPDDEVALLERMVRIRSHSGEEAELAAYLAGAMAALGFDARVDEAGNAVGDLYLGNEPRTHVVLLGHMDTVPGAIPVRLANGVLHGRGTVDAKGPLAAFVAAAARLRARAGDPAPPPSLRVTVIGCVEEEAPSSKGARHVIPHHAPDLCVVGEPSGSGAITLGYKGYLRGSARLEKTCAHTAHMAETAAERGVRFWREVEDATARFNAGRERAFDQILTTLIEFHTESDGNVAAAALEFNLRLPLDLPPSMAEAWLREISSGSPVAVRGAIPAYAGDRNTPLHRAFVKALREEGLEPRFLLKTGTADLNLVAPAWGCPALAYGPGDAALDHTPEERVEIAEFLKGVAVLERALRHLGPGSRGPGDQEPGRRLPNAAHGVGSGN